MSRGVVVDGELVSHNDYARIYHMTYWQRSDVREREGLEPLPPSDPAKIEAVDQLLAGPPERREAYFRFTADRLAERWAHAWAARRGIIDPTSNRGSARA